MQRDPAVPPPRPVRRTRAVAVTALLALIVLGLAWELWLAPLRPGGSWWVLKVLPLALPVAGLLANRLYTYRWVSLLVWPYFAEGAVRATSERGLSQGLAAAEVLLCLVLFAACAVHVRWRLRHAPRPEATAMAPATGPGDDPERTAPPAQAGGRGPRAGDTAPPRRPAAPASTRPAYSSDEGSR